MVLTLGGPGSDRSSSRGWGKARAGLPRVTAACKLRVFLTAARNSSAAKRTGAYESSCKIARGDFGEKFELYRQRCMRGSLNSEGWCS